MLGEECGGTFNIAGRCDEGLYCYIRGDPNNDVGICGKLKTHNFHWALFCERMGINMNNRKINNCLNQNQRATIQVLWLTPVFKKTSSVINSCVQRQLLTAISQNWQESTSNGDICLIKLQVPVWKFAKTYSRCWCFLGNLSNFFITNFF